MKLTVTEQAQADRTAANMAAVRADYEATEGGPRCPKCRSKAYSESIVGNIRRRSCLWCHYQAKAAL